MRGPYPYFDTDPFGLAVVQWAPELSNGPHAYPGDLGYTGQSESQSKPGSVKVRCILGPRISLVPCVGPACIRLLFGRRWRRNPDEANAPNANGLPVSMDVPQDVPIDVQDEEHVPDEKPAEALPDAGGKATHQGLLQSTSERYRI